MVAAVAVSACAPRAETNQGDGTWEGSDGDRCIRLNIGSQKVDGRVSVRGAPFNVYGKVDDSGNLTAWGMPEDLQGRRAPPVLKALIILRLLLCLTSLSQPE